MSEDVQSRQRRFEIIKIIYGNLTLQNRPSSTYKEITKMMKIQEHDVSAEIKVLGNAGFVGVQFASPDRIVYLKDVSVRAMEQRPQPTNYDVFLQATNNPQKQFGEGVRIDGPKGSFWEDHSFIKKITPVGSIITIIAFASWIIYTLFFSK